MTTLHPTATPATAPDVLVKHQIKHRYTGNVLFECELPANTPSGMAVRLALEKATESGADLRRANLRRADLSDAGLSGADLSDAKNDFWAVLLYAPREISDLRNALVSGKVNGSVYEGSCACLIGSIAKIRGVNYDDLGNGLAPKASRPAERWFLGIKTGDTPETNQISRITVEWLDEFVGLLTAAQVAA